MAKSHYSPPYYLFLVLLSLTLSLPIHRHIYSNTHTCARARAHTTIHTCLHPDGKDLGPSLNQLLVRCKVVTNWNRINDLVTFSAK